MEKAACAASSLVFGFGLLGVLCLVSPAALLAHVLQHTARDDGLGSLSLGLWLWLWRSVALGNGPRVLLIPLVPELGAPCGVPLAVCVDTLVGALKVTLVVVQRTGRRALSTLEGRQVAVEDRLVRAARVIRGAALSRPHELLSTDIGRRPSTRPQLLEVHCGTLGPELLWRLDHGRVAALLGPEPVGVALRLRGGLSGRTSSRRSSGTEVRGDVLGSHCASQPDASYEVELQG
jgi:hypothetical protein